MSDDAVVYIVDDDQAMCDSMQWLIESVGLNVQAYTKPTEFIEAYDSTPCAVLVLDMRMPEMSGLALQAALSEKEIDIPIIFISGHASVPIAVEAMKNGAVEFLTKPFGDQMLLDAIHRAIKFDRDRKERAKEVGQIKQQLATLTKRETEILEQVVLAKSSKQIAIDLGISYKTVELHRSRIIEKMQVSSTLQLIQNINKIRLFEGSKIGVTS